MGMMDPWEAELSPFQYYLDQNAKQQKTNYFNSTSTTKAVTLKELHKEPFSPTYQDNKYSTQMIEDLVFLAATRWVQDLLDPKKVTYPLMYESRAEYSWDGSSDDLKEALLGFMAVNDLADTSFSGVTDHLQVFGRIEMASSTAIGYMARNGFLYLHTTNKETSDKKTSLFHDLPGELNITAIMCAVQEAPPTRQPNRNAMDRQRNSKPDRDKLVKW